MARYQNDKKEGLYQDWYEFGNIGKECYYRNDKEEGVQAWWKNGQKWKECNYGYDKLEGIYKEWNQNGELIKECIPKWQTRYKLK